MKKKTVKADKAEVKEPRVLSEDWKIGYVMFPNMRFKDILGSLVFNATYLLEASKTGYSVETYKKDREAFVAMYASQFDLTPDQMFLEQDGDILIHCSLAIDFIANAIPEVGLYLMERSKEMLMNGVVMSDAHIIQCAKSRFPAEYLESAFKR